MNSPELNPPIRIEATLEQLVTGEYELPIPVRPEEASSLPLELRFMVTVKREPGRVRHQVSIDFLQSTDAKRLIGLDVLRAISGRFKK